MAANRVYSSLMYHLNAFFYIAELLSLGWLTIAVVQLRHKHAPGAHHAIGASTCLALAFGGLCLYNGLVTSRRPKAVTNAAQFKDSITLKMGVLADYVEQHYPDATLLIVCDSATASSLPFKSALADFAKRLGPGCKVSGVKVLSDNVGIYIDTTMSPPTYEGTNSSDAAKLMRALADSTPEATLLIDLAGVSSMCHEATTAPWPPHAKGRPAVINAALSTQQAGQDVLAGGWITAALVSTPNLSTKAGGSSGRVFVLTPPDGAGPM